MWGIGRKARKKILLVDYEKDLIEALKIRLKDNGYDVILAFDSIQGMAVAKRERPQLIILEIMIPGGGGLDVTKRLKLCTATSGIPIIVLTGIPGVEEKVCKAGASYHLMKPYNSLELLGVVKTALERSETLQNPSSLVS